MYVGNYVCVCVHVCVCTCVCGVCMMCECNFMPTKKVTAYKNLSVQKWRKITATPQILPKTTALLGGSVFVYVIIKNVCKCFELVQGQLMARWKIGEVKMTKLIQLNN